MTQFYGDFQWKLHKYLTELLQSDPYLKSIVGKRIYPQHISTLENPAFPSITLSRLGQGADTGIHQINYVRFAVDVWSKRGISELWKVYADHDATNNKPVGVRSILSQKTFDFPELIVHLCIEHKVLDNLYEEWSKTWHLHAEYRLSIAAKNVE